MRGFDADCRHGSGYLPVYRSLISIFTKPTIACCLLLAHEVAEPSAFTHLYGRPDSIPGASLAEAVIQIAQRPGHDQVCSVHFLSAFLDISRQPYEEVLEILAERYRSKHPLGSKRQQRLVEYARQIGREDLAHDLENHIHETRFAPGKVLEIVSGYLSSEYYPFGYREYELFKTKPDDPSVSAFFLATFSGMPEE